MTNAITLSSITTTSNLDDGEFPVSDEFEETVSSFSDHSQFIQAFHRRMAEQNTPSLLHLEAALQSTSQSCTLKLNSERRGRVEATRLG